MNIDKYRITAHAALQKIILKSEPKFDIKTTLDSLKTRNTCFEDTLTT